MLVLRFALLASVALTFVPPAYAQSSSGSSDAGGEKSAHVQDDPSDIVVTAQRRSERLQDVPISLAVVGGTTLQDRSIQTFDQLAPLVPNLTISKTPAANLIILRGIGSSPGSPSLDQSVVMFIDGIYAGNARQFATPFLDIERLEVLRGPQGALVGRNTSAGAINVITRKPGDDFGGYVNATYNFTFDGPAIEGGLDLPVSDAIKLRVVGKYADVDGYIRNPLVDEDQPRRREGVGRVSLRIDNGGPVTVNAKYEHADARLTGSPVQLIAPTVGEFLDYTKSTRLPAGKEHDNIKTDNAVVQFDMDLGGPTLVSISGYSGFTNRQLIDADFFAGDFAVADFDQTFDQVSQEVRLVSPDSGRFRYVLGAYYSGSTLFEERTTGVLFAPPASTYRTFKQSEEVFSGYGQATFLLTDALRVSGSLRYTHTDKHARYTRIAGALAQTNRTGTSVADFSQDLSNGRVDPAASIQYSFTPNTMVYASYSRGSKVGGFQGAISNANPAAFSFRPERSESYEGGMKLSFPGIGYFNLAGFSTVYRDLQVSTAISIPGSLANLFFTGNAPRALTQGFEAEFSLRPTRFFSLDGSLAWLPTAKYTDFTAGPCYIQQPSNGSLAGSCNQSGMRLGLAPRYSGSITGTVTAPVGADLALKGSLSPILQGRSFRDFTNDPVTVQKSFVKLDARIALAGGQDRWEVAVIGQNLTDRRTLGFGSTAGLANTVLSPTARSGVIDPPRSISIQARFKF